MFMTHRGTQNPYPSAFPYPNHYPYSGPPMKMYPPLSPLDPYHGYQVGSIPHGHGVFGVQSQGAAAKGKIYFIFWLSK